MSLTAIVTSVPRKRAVDALVVLSLVAAPLGVGVVFSAAFANTCSTRHTYIEQGFEDSPTDYAIKGRVANSSCNNAGGNYLDLRIKHDDRFGRDDVIASTEYNVQGYSSYTRSLRGCRNGTATYFTEADTAAGRQKSSYRDFKDCNLQ